jgi:adenosylhomocysteine nucleosidase
MKVGIIAALPREVAALVKGWEHRRLPARVHLYTRRNAVVVCAGMGATRATLAVQAAMEAMPLTDLLSVGLAGACDPALRVGEIVRPGLVIDSRTGEQLSESQYKQVLVTAPAVAGVHEKARLYASYHATAVDMEASTVGRLARAHGLAFRAIKAISDEADFEMRELAKFETPDGQFREAAFAMHVAVHPGLWSNTIRLAGNSNRALVSLTAALKGELDWYTKRA